MKELLLTLSCILMSPFTIMGFIYEFIRDGFVVGRRLETAFLKSITEKEVIK